MVDSGRRNDVRVKARVKVRFRDDEALFSEFTHNISKGGLFVRTTTPCALGAQVEVVLILPDSETEIKAQGRVIHIVSPAEASATRPAGMGLHLLDLAPRDQKALEEYIKDRLAKAGADTLGRRQHPRYHARLRVRFGNVIALQVEYSLNISHGGIFIKTRNPKPLGERLLLILIHPQTGQELELEGEVVRVVTTHQARESAQPAGMGILFCNLDQGLRQKIEDFIRPELFPNVEMEAP
jgi:type IV pilus assembly protein PilZ